MAVTGRSEFSAALNQVAHERGLDPFEVLDTIKAAILAAYRRDYDPEAGDELEVQIDQESGEVKLIKEEKDITPAGFGRIAAQTAKQVLLQRIREAEKTAIITDYSKKIGTIVTGMVQRQQGPAYIIDTGRAEAVMPPREQVRTEHYYLNQRLKFYITEIRDHDKRSEIIVSRVNPELIVGLFKQEVPEIAAGSVEIKAIAREPGFRTKIAVTSHQLGVDPVGSCVGQRGNRIQTVINELMGEKIDVIAYNEDPVKFMTAALQPAKNVQIRITDEKTEDGLQKAIAIVADDELSLAIGSKGQNVRLAARLTGYHIDVVSKEQSVSGEIGKTAAKTEVIAGNIFTDNVEESATESLAPKKNDQEKLESEAVAAETAASVEESPSEEAPAADEAISVNETVEEKSEDALSKSSADNVSDMKDAKPAKKPAKKRKSTKKD